MLKKGIRNYRFFSKGINNLIQGFLQNEIVNNRVIRVVLSIINLYCNCGVHGRPSYYFRSFSN